MTTEHLAALSVKLPSTGNTLQVLPAGAFRPIDGRPMKVPAWTINRHSAAQIIEAASASKVKLLVDYEHQSLKAQDNGQPVPAAGWFKTLEWREGEGLFATDVEWTEKAQGMIQRGEYR